MAKNLSENVIPLFKSRDTSKKVKEVDTNPFEDVIQKNHEKNEKLRKSRVKINEQVIKNYRLKK